MDHRIVNRMDFIQKCGDNKLHEFTVQDLKEIFIDFNYMYERLQKSKQEHFSVFEFEVFIQYLRNKDFPSAQKSKDGALREYKLVHTLFDRLDKKHNETNFHRRHLSHVSVERNTDQGKKQSILNDEKKSVPKTDNTESRYSPQSELETGGIVGTDGKGNSSQNVNLEERNELGLSANATLTEKDRKNVDESRQNTELLSNNHVEKGKENYNLFDSFHGSNDDKFIPTETTYEVSRFSNSKLSSRSKDPSIRETDRGENDRIHKDLKQSHHKGDGFGIENSTGSVTQTITEHGYTNDTGAALGPGINKNKRSLESPRYRDSTRRSEDANLLLYQGNPNNLNASDNNQPTILAQRFSTLYSNEYTEAFEFLQKQGLEEKYIVYDLLRIVRHAYGYCRQRASEELSKRMHSMQQEGNAFKEEEETIKDLTLRKLKMDAPYLRHDVCDTFVMKVFWKLIPKEIDPSNIYLITYAWNCVDIVWFMCVQDPPISMSWVKKGDTFDTSLYRSYTKNGTKVDFCVWPLVLLADSGPVLTKGIAQGK